MRGLGIRLLLCGFMAKRDIFEYRVERVDGDRALDALLNRMGYDGFALDRVVGDLYIFVRSREITVSGRER